MNRAKTFVGHIQKNAGGEKISILVHNLDPNGNGEGGWTLGISVYASILFMCAWCTEGEINLMKKIMSVFMILTLALFYQNKCLCLAQDNVKIIKVPCVEESRNGASNKESKVYSGAKLIKTKVKAVASGVSKQIAKGSMAVKSGSTKLKDQLAWLATSAEPKVAAVSHFLSKPVVLASVAATVGLAGIAGWVYYFVFRSGQQPKNFQNVKENFSDSRDICLLDPHLYCDARSPHGELSNTTFVNMTKPLSNRDGELSDLNNDPAVLAQQSQKNGASTTEQTYASDNNEPGCLSIGCNVANCTKYRKTNITGIICKNMFSKDSTMEYLPEKGDCREKAFVYGYYANLRETYPTQKNSNFAPLACTKYLYDGHGFNKDACKDLNYLQCFKDEVNKCVSTFFDSGSPKLTDYDDIARFYADPIEYRAQLKN